jgi:hypothetical protein
MSARDSDATVHSTRAPRTPNCLAYSETRRCTLIIMNHCVKLRSTGPRNLMRGSVLRKG